MTMESIGTPETPASRSNAAAYADLSPPNSQGPNSGATASTTTSSPSAPNANGKRPLSTLDNNHEALQPAARAPASSTSATANGQQEPKTHGPSGYTWTQPEDAPGYGWKNKRAAEEAERAWAQVLNKDRKVGNRYGDIFDMVAREGGSLTERQGMR